MLAGALPDGTRLVLAGDGPQRAELEALAAADDRDPLPRPLAEGRAVELLRGARLPRRPVADDAALEGAVGEHARRRPRHGLADRGLGQRRHRRTSWGRPACSSPKETPTPCGRARSPARRHGAARAAGRRWTGAFPPGVRHPGLRPQDRERTETSRTLGSLGRVSVLEKTAPEAAPVEAPPRDDRVTTITPATRLPKLDLRELWRYRELALTFVWRDLKVRYKQTFIGILWVVLQPLLATGIFTLIFGRFADFPSDDVCRTRSSSSPA